MCVQGLVFRIHACWLRSVAGFGSERIRTTEHREVNESLEKSKQKSGESLLVAGFGSERFQQRRGRRVLSFGAQNEVGHESYYTSTHISLSIISLYRCNRLQ